MIVPAFFPVGCDSPYKKMNKKSKEDTVQNIKFMKDLALSKV